MYQTIIILFSLSVDRRRPFGENTASSFDVSDDSVTSKTHRGNQNRPEVVTINVRCLRTFKNLSKILSEKTLVLRIWPSQEQKLVTELS